MIAASIADLDGLGFFFGEEAYWRFHHIVGHNVFVGVGIAGALAALSTRRALAFAAYVVLFHLHLLLDFYGSGIGWKIHYFWPMDSRGYKTSNAWPLASWQNFVTFGFLSAITIGIALRKRRTPIELLLPRLEAKWFRPAEGRDRDL